MLVNRLALLAGVPIFLALALAAALLYRFAANERSEQSWVSHTYQVENGVRAVLDDVERAEADQRGYLLTRAPLYLDAYRAARAAFGSDLAKVQFLTADNPSQQHRIAKIRAAADARFDDLAQSLAAGAQVAPSSPVLVDKLRRGRASMDSLQSLIVAALGEEGRLLQERTRATRVFEGETILMAAFGSVIALILLAAAAILLVRNNVQLARSEAERSHQADVLQATLDSMRDGIAVFETDGTLAAFNQNFFDLLGFPATLAQSGAELKDFRSIDEARATGIFANLPGGEPGDRGVRRLVIANHELDLYRTAVPKDGFLIVAADVTARVRSEDALRQAQKMEAVGHLTGGVAHDFNNLLQIVSANLDLVMADVRGNPQSASRLQSAIVAVERGAHLTTQLLAFARRQALEPRAIDPGRLMQDVTGLLRRTLGEQVEVESIVAGGLWNTVVDPNQLQNAILNLAINARDAMPEGGKLTIEVGNAFLDDDYARRHSEVIPGQYVMIAVSDTGLGMTPETVARAFDPFFTTKPEGRGTGLGLSQVYGFVKQSGGHVKLYSEVGHGTTVKLYIPRTRKPLESTIPEAMAPVDGGKETILVVEDDEGVRAAVTDMLGELGYGVLKAENAEQALAILSGGATVDLLFTDVVMPGAVTARELARRARESDPAIKILFTSGYTQNAIVHNGRLDDDVFLLSKPYRKNDLARKLRSLLDSRDARPQHPSIVQTPSRPAAQPTGFKKALVVEDIALIRITTVDMLAEIGLQSVEAGDGLSALKLVDSDPQIDVMIADLGLPGMSGRELVAEVRRRRPDLKIVIASGDTGGKTRSEAVLAGVVFLAKPYDIEQLRRAVQTG
ncbi:MAG: response regulator [Rhizomicrobium sp.]|jgi:signal transduction histidine kinase/DNA-binding response OmpR family regulator